MPQPSCSVFLTTSSLISKVHQHNWDSPEDHSHDRLQRFHLGAHPEAMPALSVGRQSTSVPHRSKTQFPWTCNPSYRSLGIRNPLSLQVLWSSLRCDTLCSRQDHHPAWVNSFRFWSTFRYREPACFHARHMEGDCPPRLCACFSFNLEHLEDGTLMMTAAKVEGAPNRFVSNLLVRCRG